MLPPINRGHSDFVSLRRRGELYVDRSAFIGAVLGNPNRVLLFPRPRRFGKTLAMSMLRAWLERGPDNAALFGDLAVWADPVAQAHRQRYAVIALSLKDAKAATWTEARRTLTLLVQQELLRCRPVWSDARVDPALRDLLQADLAQADHPLVLPRLCAALRQATGEGAVLLIDEYDAPLINGWEQGHYGEALAWYRSFFGAAFKDNPDLALGVCTGVLQVGEESTWSDLSNVTVAGLLDAQPFEPFGFGEADVADLLARAGRSDEAEAVRAWYNGYAIAGHTVYNPWSVLRALQHPGRPLSPWWVNTSQNVLVRRLLLSHHELGAGLERLLRGETVEVVIEEAIPLGDLRPHHVWSLLLGSGYLTARSVRWEDGRRRALLAIPNGEVASLWRATFLDWLDPGEREGAPLIAALLRGDAEALGAEIEALLRLHASAHDLTATQDEAFYHAFLLGLLVRFSATHEVRSNRETGLGRADVLMIPRRPGLPGVVMELKRLPRRGGDLHRLAETALEQIQTRGYADALVAAGAAPVQAFGLSFAGRELAVVGETVAQGPLRPEIDSTVSR
jgi:hypothetical protein